MITKKTKVYGIFSLIFFAVTAAAVVFMWYYVRTEGDELLTQAKEVADYSAREQTYRELAELVESTQVDRDELNAYVLTEEKTIDFLSAVEEIAYDQGIELTTNSLKVVEGKRIFDTLNITFAVDGMQTRVYTMLEILETLPYHSSVSRISFQNSDDSGVAMVRGTIELSVSLLHYDR